MTPLPDPAHRPALCLHCGEPVEPGEQIPNQPEPLHFECAFRLIAGSAAHILGECSCFGGTRSDPPGLSKRAAARLASEAFLQTAKRIP